MNYALKQFQLHLLYIPAYVLCLSLNVSYYNIVFIYMMHILYVFIYIFLCKNGGFPSVTHWFILFFCISQPSKSVLKGFKQNSTIEHPTLNRIFSKCPTKKKNFCCKISKFHFYTFFVSLVFAKTKDPSLAFTYPNFYIEYLPKCIAVCQALFYRWTPFQISLR